MKLWRSSKDHLLTSDNVNAYTADIKTQNQKGLHWLRYCYIIPGVDGTARLRIVLDEWMNKRMVQSAEWMKVRILKEIDG